MIDIYYFGKIKNKNINKLIKYYKKLSSRNLKIKLKNLKEEKESNLKKKKKKELKRVQNKIKKDKNYSIILDYRGRIITTEKFSDKINNKLKHGRHLSFYIGNYYGFDENTLKKADMVLSLSRMTFNHELAILLLVEQVYRANSIIFGGNYHK